MSDNSCPLHDNAAPRRRRRSAIAAVAVLGLGATLASIGPVRPAAAAGGCQWLTSSGGTADYETRFFDPSATPLKLLSVGSTFGTEGSVSKDGGVDFDPDGRTDVFRTVARPDGLRQWQYSSAASSAFTNLAFAAEGVGAIRFGDFNGDALTDPFVARPRAHGGYDWLVSFGGTQSYVVLNHGLALPQNLRLGDFDGNGVTDVFTAEEQPDGSFQYMYSAASPTGSTWPSTPARSISCASATSTATRRPTSSARRSSGLVPTSGATPRAGRRIGSTSSRPRRP